MRVVKADQSRAVWPMQRKRVVDAVGSLRRHRHKRDRKPDPVTALGIDHEDLPIEIDEQIEGRITRLRHATKLSD